MGFRVGRVPIGPDDEEHEEGDVEAGRVLLHGASGMANYYDL